MERCWWPGLKSSYSGAGLGSDLWFIPLGYSFLLWLLEALSDTWRLTLDAVALSILLLSFGFPQTLIVSYWACVYVMATHPFVE